jgi:hypothetical protein
VSLAVALDPQPQLRVGDANAVANRRPVAGDELVAPQRADPWVDIATALWLSTELSVGMSIFKPQDAGSTAATRSSIAIRLFIGRLRSG